MIRHQIKNGVWLQGLQPQMAIAFTVACSVYASKELSCIITCGLNGKHGRYSHHYKGLALDLRTKHCFIGEKDRSAKLTQLKIDIQLSLGTQFQVVLEDVGGEQEHLHIEFDPQHL